MKLSEFDFDLPQDRIAQAPVFPRDAARLLCVGETLRDATVRDLPSILWPGDVLVYNDTRVLKARLTGRRGTAKIETTLHKMEGPDLWRAFAKGAKRLKLGDRIDYAPGFSATVEAKDEDVLLRFSASGPALMEALDKHGAMPLPPYIKRASPDAADERNYQTVFAAKDGAVAASTAGLHFTPDLLARIDAAGVERIALTLHIGAGTFLPVKTENVEDHPMHAEWGEISADTAAKIERARSQGRRIVALGTTALRLLETVAQEDGRVRAWAGETRLFCLPGFRFRVVDALFTNFHLPKSTLFMLVCAFAGTARMKNAYAHAIASGYRFFSYGDASLIERQG
ncbi:MAG: tRNA preQ1(34) S-adenosylmethionine ribosyltransferase-isomerase QueA [Tagaea sp.]